MQHEIKLQQKSKELILRGRKIQFLPRPAVQLELYRMDELVGKFTGISPFRYVLPDQLVRILYCSFLPGGIAVCEVDCGFQGICHPLVPAELTPVVRGYRQHIPPVGSQEPDDCLRDFVRILPERKFLYDDVVPAPLAQHKNRTLPVFPYNQVQLPVSEVFPVCRRRPEMDTDPPPFAGMAADQMRRKRRIGEDAYYVLSE